MTDIGVGSWPARRARISPDAPALQQDDRSFSYAQTAVRVDALATALADLGLAQGDRIAYLGPNDIATFETFYAAGRLGAVFVPLNTRLAPAEISYMLADCGVKILVYGGQSGDLVQSADPAGSGVATLIAVDSYAPAGGLAYQTLFSDGRPLRPRQVTLADNAMIFYTSGTTGRPKGAVLTHGNVTFNVVNQLAHLDVRSCDVALCTAPLFHVSGLGQVSMPTVFKGGALVIASKFDPAGILAAIVEHRITAISSVPTMLQMLCDHPGFAAADLSSVRYINYGGSPVPARVAQAWLDRGITLLQGYGMTEASPGVLLATPEGVQGRPLSSGVPQFFSDLAMLSPDGKPGEPTGTGELLVRGPNVFPGYWNRPTETEAAFTDGWFRTGDVVRIDTDGWAYVVDRVKDMIISGGENVYPAEVEAVLTQMPGVAEAAVIALPDEKWGEVGMAFLVPVAGHTVDLESVRAFLDGRLARYKIPKYVQLTDLLPRTASGKVRKSELRPAGRRTSDPESVSENA